MPAVEHQYDWDRISLLGGSIQCLLWMQLQLCCHLKQTKKINKKKEKHRFISWKEKGEWREKTTKRMFNSPFNARLQRALHPYS
jgi:hypothetical protein